jgi:hypothetical protein
MKRRTTLIGRLACALAAGACGVTFDEAPFGHDVAPTPGAGGAGTTTTAGTGGSAEGGAAGSGAGASEGGGGGAGGACAFDASCPCGKPPLDWAGPFLASETSDVDNPTCSGGAAPIVAFRDPKATGSCGACTCTPTCGPLGAIASHPSNCGDAGTTVANKLGCADFAATAYPAAVTIAPPAASCSTAGGTPSFATPSWSAAVQLCPLPKELPPPPGASHCIARPGDHDCPLMGVRHLYHQGYLDERACSSCGCTVTKGCVAETDLKSNVGCSGGTQTVPNDGKCYAAAGQHSFTTKVVASTTCSPSQSVVQGAVVPDPGKALTVCCLEPLLQQ